jgi:hypothetical protein
LLVGLLILYLVDLLLSLMKSFLLLMDLFLWPVALCYHTVSSSAQKQTSPYKTSPRKTFPKKTSPEQNASL